MEAPENVAKYIILDDGTTVKETFYNMIFQQINEVLPAVMPNVQYTAEDLCGKEFWKQLTGMKYPKKN